MTYDLTFSIIEGTTLVAQSFTVWGQEWLREAAPVAIGTAAKPVEGYGFVATSHCWSEERQTELESWLYDSALNVAVFRENHTPSEVA